MQDLVLQDRADMRAILRTAEGARFFCRLMDFCGVDRQSYVPDEGKAHAAEVAVFREGQRSVGLMLRAEVREAGAEDALLRARDEREGIFDADADGPRREDDENEEVV